MKKTLTLILSALVLISVLALTACESKVTEENSKNQSTVESSEDKSDKENSEDKTDKENSEDKTDKENSEDKSDNDTSEDKSDEKTDDTSSEDKSARDKENDKDSKIEKDGKEISPTEKETKEVIPASDKGKAIAETARDMLGKPFKWAGATPEEGFDNSGLIYYALTKEGINAPRLLSDQFNMGTEVSRDELQEGDIVFFTDEDFYIASIYVGDDTVIYSPYPEKVVRTADLNSVYYNENYLKAVRVS